MSFDDLKRQIKEYPISKILTHYVLLVEKGRDIKCSCPFHDDKNPSMYINNTKGMYWCFSCQKGGDAINFVMELKHLDFLSAIKDIASHLNLTKEDSPSKDADEFLKPLGYSLESTERILDASKRLAILSPPPLKSFRSIEHT